MYLASDLIGNLARDPQQRTLDNGVLLCSFDVACNIGGRDKPPVWVHVSCFRETAENCIKFLRKGSKVFVHGTPAATAWQDREGRLHAQLEVTASTVRFLSSKQDDAAADQSAVPAGDDHGLTQVDDEEPPF